VVPKTEEWIAFIGGGVVIRKILERLQLWEEPESRPQPAGLEQADIQYVPFFDS